MKIITKSVLLVSVASFLIILTSCRCVQGEGPVTTQSRDVADFSEIELELSGSVYLTQGSSYSVDVTAQENLHELITTEVSGDKLKISHKGSCISSDGNINFEISLPKLEGVFLKGSGNISSRSAFRVDKVETEIDGSGNIILDLIAQEIESEISGSGNIEISGTTQSQDVEIEGSGNYRAGELTSYNAKIEVDGSGDCYVLVHDKLIVNISGSGNVYYEGTPKIESKINGSGSLSRR